MSPKVFADDVQNKYYFVDHRRLVLDENFIEREDYDDIDLIITWIKANGIQNLNPLKCYKRGDQYVIRRGSRRNAAIQKMATLSGEIIMVPIILIKKGDSIERQYFEQATENEGKPYTPWEKSKVLKKARNEYGWSEKKMIEESGWSNVYVHRLLSLADAPERLTLLVRNRKVSATLAMDTIAEAASKEDPKLVEDLIDQGEALTGGATLKASAEDGLLFPSETEDSKPRKVTKSDIKPNSVKVFRKWSKNVKEEELEPEKAQIFKFIQRMIAGELTEKDIKKFFR